MVEVLLLRLLRLSGTCTARVAGTDAHCNTCTDADADGGAGARADDTSDVCCTLALEIVVVMMVKVLLLLLLLLVLLLLLQLSGTCTCTARVAETGAHSDACTDAGVDGGGTASADDTSDVCCMLTLSANLDFRT